MRSKHTIFLAAAAAAFFATPEHADAVGTRRFVLDSLESFEGGDLAGVAISSTGEVRAGWTLTNTPIPDASSVWSQVVLSDGRILLGTGTGGRIYQVKNGKVTLAAETGAMAVSSLVVGPGGDVIAGTFPEGKIFRIKPTELGNTSKLKPWLELKETEDVWGLAYDAKSNALYAATGPNGKLFRITDAGKAEVYFDSEEPHLVSVALAGDGSVYTGSNGNGLLYRLTGPGRAEVVHDFDTDDVKAIAVHPSGSVYAIGNEYKDSFKGLRRQSGSGLSTAGPSQPKPAKAGKGKLMRFDKRGVAELMLEEDSEHFVTLALDESGLPYVGTGAEGKVYSVNDNHERRLLADTDERQVGAMALVGKQRFLVTSDPVVVHTIDGSGGPDAMWTSKVLDAGLRAHFGLLEWRGDGTIEVMTRSGNTEKPDATWSAWSAPMSKPGKVQSPAARYLQIRARFGRDANAVLREVKAAFVTDNARALITEISVGDSQSDTGSDKVPESGSAPDEPEAKLKISWKVDNPDNDKLRYRLFYKPVGGAAWFSMLSPNEELTKTSYTWDTGGLPEGHYLIRVDASDELANPPERVTRHSLGSNVVVVDNTPPLLTKLSLNGNRLQGTATDGVGPIQRIEFQLVGAESWFPVFPSDSVFDEPSESFDVDVSNYVPTGPHLVVVRAYDGAGNRVTRTVSRSR